MRTSFSLTVMALPSTVMLSVWIMRLLTAHNLRFRFPHGWRLRLRRGFRAGVDRIASIFTVWNVPPSWPFPPSEWWMYAGVPPYSPFDPFDDLGAFGMNNYEDYPWTF
ncbi:rh222 [macacine betaherpesvirus 3]|uniref:Rh222 n=1 Tax=Rhesus cytomegalovirus (strain 68-1) TaxID=47929 RepID=Q7TFC2_RHCM6|nr:rh222 [macacine betaherpesvirus 3]AAP50742.1 rh222 [macacine betaherpesvirus 3]AAZ80740.1 rh222 [macacine betaherpesvirus 3]